MTFNSQTLTRRRNRYIRLSALLVFAAVLTALIVLLAGNNRAYGWDQEIDKLNRFVQASNTSETATRVFQTARDHIAGEDWKSAERSFAGFIDSYPADKNVDAALYWLAFALEKQNRLREADQALERLIKEHPQSSWVVDATARRIKLAPRLKNDRTIEAGINEEEEEIRLAALQSLFDSRPDRAMKLALEIIKPDSKESSAMKEGAITLIADRGERQAIPVLIDIARNDPDPKLRRRAIRMLGSIEDDSVIDFLSEMAAKSSDSEIAHQAIRAIGDHESARALSSLVQIARSSSDAELRAQAISMLGDREDQGSADALIQLYDVEKEEHVKEKIIDALGETEQKQALKKLMEIVKSNAPASLKKRAISALGDSEDPEASKFLEDLLKKNN
ncbi:MAG TPA: HEAT repeat domain-containing protein [Blastocatellia bacterium]|nr:HEAT repeat domain-containing protein [Blastocatellia bacterium]